MRTQPPQLKISVSGFTSNSVSVLELKKLGIEVDFPPTKLRSGNGEGVCTVLLLLTKKTLQAKKIRFKKPIFKDDPTEADDGDDIQGAGGDDNDGADIADLANDHNKLNESIDDEVR